MSSTSLPTIQQGDILIVKIPTYIFGKRVTIQAHEIHTPKRGRDVCDGHECDQSDAKGDIKFFSRVVNISKI